METLLSEATNAPRTKFLGKLRVIMVEDSENDAYIIARVLSAESEDFDSFRVETRDEMHAALENCDCDLVLCDHDMPEFNAFDALEVLRERGLDIPFIVVTGAIGGEEAAVSLMREGANDYVPKHKLDRLAPAVRRELQEASNRRKKKAADEELRLKNDELRAALGKLAEAQRDLVRAERLKSIGQIAAGVADDFDTALSRIGTVTEQMERKASSDLSNDFLQLKSSVSDAARVVERLRYSRQVSPNRNTPSRQSVGINQVIEKSAAMVGPRLGGSDGPACVRADYQLGTDLPPVAGEMTELCEAITNVIHNSCDAMPNGGTIQFRSFRDGDAVVAEISDNGSGMTKDVLEQCLDPFFSTKGDLGSGLGLTLVDGLMQRYGGVLRVDSVAGIGTTVSLRFAADEELDVYPGRNTEPAPMLRPLSVIIVGGEAENTALLECFLQLDGHRVTTSTDTTDAESRIAAGGFDVVILDQTSLETRALTFAQRMRDARRLEGVVVVTKANSGEVSTPSIPSELGRALPKPIGRVALRNALTEVQPEPGLPA